jgi:membrane-associated phospholipid phosphatase
MDPVRRVSVVLVVGLVLAVPNRCNAESVLVGEAKPEAPEAAEPCLESATPGSTDAPAAESDAKAVLSLPAMALQDAVYVLGSPLHWTGRDWAIAGGAVVGVVVLSAFVDVSARDAALKHRSGALDDLTRVVEPFGTQYSWAVLGAYGVAGLVFHDADLRDTAIDGAIASAIASGVITPALKRIVGRSRPDQQEGSLSFDFFGSSTSFPSGHATQAFAVASVISAHSDKTWVSVSAYTLAGLVGFARVYHNAHWVSDVAAGALIGTVVGRGVVALNTRIRSGQSHVKVVFAPILGDRERGAGLTIVF